MPHNLSSPSGDTLLARAVGDLPSELTVHIGDNGTRAVGTLAWTVEQTLDHLVACSSGTPCSAPPQRRCTPRFTPPPPSMPVGTTASRSSRRERRCC